MMILFIFFIIAIVTMRLRPLHCHLLMQPWRLSHRRWPSVTLKQPPVITVHSVVAPQLLLTCL